MINAVTGELGFVNLVLKPHQLKEVFISGEKGSFLNIFPEKADNPIAGFTTIFLPEAVNELGTFELQLTFDPYQHLVLVTACHQNVFYESESPLDLERRAFHESIVVRHFFCEVEEQNYLAVIYTPGSGVPLAEAVAPRSLSGKKVLEKREK